jgi:hypothetical protein
VRKIRAMMVLFVVLIASLAITAASASAATVLGNTSVQSGSDNNDAGSSEAFPFTSSASGSTVAASVYVDSASAATGLVVGLYSDGAGAPGTLLGQASLSSPSSGAWDTFAFPSVSISASTRYWLAVLGTGGRLNFRDDSTDGSCQSVTSAAADLTSMPSSFSGVSWNTCNVSAYLSVADATLSGAPIVSGALPSVSGDFSFHGSGELGYGGTVSATEGIWTYSDAMPPTFQFQWQECDSSGDNCSNTSATGRIPDEYIITPGEVGNTIRVAVTATNGDGATIAYSAVSPIITSS